MSTGSPCAHVKSSSDGEEQDRPERMRDWLIRMINSARFPGLVWLDQDKTVFKVPWIHAKKRGYDRKRDAALFKEWAIHSGKYRDESDPTVWKINFRCAINGLKDIVELKDYQTEDCRVYKVLPRTRPIRKRRRSVPRSSDAAFPNYTVNGASTTVLPSSAGVWHSNSTYATPNAVVSEPYSATYQSNMGIPYSSSAISNVQGSNGCGYYYNNSSSPAVPPYSQSVYSSPVASSLQMNNGMSPLQDTTASSCMQTSSTNTSSICSSGSSPLAIRRQETPDSGYGGVVDSTNSVIDSPLQMCPSPETHGYNSPTCIPSVSSCSGIDQPCSVGGGSSSVLPSCSQSIIASPSPSSNRQAVNTMTTTEENIISVLEDLEEKSPHPLSPLHDPPPPNQLNISVYYGSVQVLSKTVQCSKGCRIYSGQYSTPTTDDQAATFESCFGPLEADQICLPSTHPLPEAQQIFDSMNRGLLIEMHENNIYATPLCRTIVYCGTSYYQTSQQLEKERRMKVFDYQEHFQPALEQYSLNRGPAPDPHVIFSLGQHWSPSKPITQNCIFIVVSHVQARHDLDVFGPPFTFNHHHLFGTVSGSVDVRQNSTSDIRAEAFLNTVYPC